MPPTPPQGAASGFQILLPSATRTAEQTIELADWAGISVILDLTSLNAVTPGLTVHIEGLDPASSKWITLLSSAAITTVSTNGPITVSPHVLGAANVARLMRLPKRFRVRVAVADADAATYSLGAWLEPM